MEELELCAFETSPLIGASVARFAIQLDELLSGPLDDTVHGRLRLARSRLRLQQGNLDQAIDDILTAGPLLKDLPEYDLEAQLVAVRLLNRTGRRAEAHELLAEASAKVPSSNRSVRLEAALAQGEIALDEGRPEAEAHFTVAVGLARVRPAERYQAQMSLCLLAQARQDSFKALGQARAARATATGCGALVLAAEASLTVGNLAVAQGDLVLAREAYQEALQGPLAAPAKATAFCLLARVELFAHQAERAMELALEGAKLAAAQGLAAGYADGMLVAAQAIAAQGERVEAERLLNTGVAVLASRGEDALAELLKAGLAELTVH